MVDSQIAPNLATQGYEEQLAELSLTIDVIHRAVNAGLSARNSRTKLAPRNAPGTDLYSHTVEELRMQLVPLNWTAVCHRGQELTVSPDGSVAIVVSRGDGAVGADGLCWTAHPKGPLMRSAIVRNQKHIQGELFELPTPDEAGEQSKFENAAVWILLTKMDSEYLHLELSLPDNISDDGRVESWDRRIQLPSIPLGGPQIPQIDLAANAIDITVEPR